jgi:hypothetical protein
MTGSMPITITPASKASPIVPFGLGLSALCALLWFAPLPAKAGGAAAESPTAATQPAKPAKAAPKRSKRRKAAASEPPPAAATAEQLEAAERVFYGPHRCEFEQSVDVALDPQRPGYVDVKFGKARYVMKPVISSTGAVRLEDVRGEALMVQITAKSMLMDVKAGRRLVDECVSDKHHEAMAAVMQSEAAANAAAASAAAAAAAASASAPAGAQ